MSDGISAPPDAPAEDLLRTSALLRELVLDNPAEIITLGEVLTRLGERAFGFMIFLLAFPNCLPVPPGFSTVTGVLIFPIAIQFLLGRRRPHLPRGVRRHPIHRAVLARAVRVILPVLESLERLFEPRWQFFYHGWGEKIVGAFMLLLTLMLLVPLPPPLHFLPGAGLALMALGIMERDGILTAAGMALGAGGITALGLVAKWVIKFFVKIFHHWGTVQ